MRQLKIYDKSYTPITSFNTGEFTNLSYKKTINQIGDASFVLDISNAKVTMLSVQNYNRIEIIEDGVIKWSGYIIEKQITSNDVTIKCKELIGILSKRLTVNGYTINGNAGAGVTALLNSINSIEDTGISMGTTNVTTNINLTFNNQDVLSALQSIADAAQAQFIVTTDRKLNFMSNIGSDKSDNIQFEYNINQTQQANILKFNVSDSGDNIVTKAYGTNSTLNSTQTDNTLKNKYGILEKFNSFTQANNQTNLDALTLSLISDTLYSPSLDLVPSELDNFDIGDIVKINIKNKLIDIDDSFQILEKNVKIINSQRSISIKINQLPQDITNYLKDLQRQVNLLITN